MRILYLVPDLLGPPGGIARYCRLVVRALSESERVHHLDVLALHDRSERLVDRGVVDPARTAYRGFASDRRAFSTAALAALLCGRYDVALAGHVNFSPLLLAARMRLPRARRVVFVYGIDVWTRLPWLRRVGLRHADRVIAISRHSAARALAANQLQPQRLTVLHNCLDPVLDPGSIPPHPDGAAILTVARLSRTDSYKGHETVIRALPRIVERVPCAEYLIVGEGDLRPDLERLAKEVGVRAHVSFLGRVSDAALRKCYARCSVFAMPSTDEGFGFVFLEAMAHGRPVVCGNRDAGPEVIGCDGSAGRVIDPGDPAQLADAIVPMLLERDLQRSMGEAGRARVESLFSYARFTQELLEQLNESWRSTALAAHSPLERQQR